MRDGSLFLVGLDNKNIERFKLFMKVNAEKHNEPDGFNRKKSAYIAEDTLPN